MYHQLRTQPQTVPAHRSYRVLHVKLRILSAATLLAASLALSGCGSSDTATFHDPNPEDAYTSGSAIREPVAVYGADALERAKAVGRVRGRLATARALAAQSVQPRHVRTLVQSIRNADLPMLLPHVAVTDPPTYLATVRGVRELEIASDVPTFIEAANRLIAQTPGLRRAVVPTDARADASFNAAVFAALLEQAGLAYEQAFVTNEQRLEDENEYRLAHGLLVELSSPAALTSVPPAARREVARDLRQVQRQVTPSPTTPPQPIPPEEGAGRIYAVMDRVTEAADIDTTVAPLDPALSDRLRLLGDAVGRSREAFAAGAVREARREILEAHQQHFTAAANGIATVDPAMLARIEKGLTLDLLPAIDRRVSEAAFEQRAITLQNDLASFRDVVDEELRQLEESL